LPDLTTTPAAATAAPGSKPLAPAVTPAGVPETPKPASKGSLKPTSEQIQTALKNAGYYYGPIDGKIGRTTEAAIETFQASNDLKPDGKAGPKTWAILGKYLKKSKKN
jgi:peptidoglycan hydrolase-like protein with peptidoglycan-binding domain